MERRQKNLLNKQISWGLKKNDFLNECGSKGQLLQEKNQKPNRKKNERNRCNNIGNNL